MRDGLVKLVLRSRNGDCKAAVNELKTLMESKGIDHHIDDTPLYIECNDYDIESDEIDMIREIVRRDRMCDVVVFKRTDKFLNLF